MSARPAHVIVVAGSNGAGKSTAAPYLLRDAPCKLPGMKHEPWQLRQPWLAAARFLCPAGALLVMLLALALLPMAQRIDAESEPAGELFLSHAELRANGSHVDQGRGMEPVIWVRSGARRGGPGGRPQRAIAF